MYAWNELGITRAEMHGPDAPQACRTASRHCATQPSALLHHSHKSSAPTTESVPNNICQTVHKRQWKQSDCRTDVMYIYCRHMSLLYSIKLFMEYMTLLLWHRP